VLREDLEAAQAEAALAQEMEALLQSELQELHAQHNEASQDAAAVLEDHRQRLLPKIQQMQEVRRIHVARWGEGGEGSTACLHLGGLQHREVPVCAMLTFNTKRLAA
jgi:seryl-tRNA synthetase